jgi:hypothetical protein
MSSEEIEKKKRRMAANKKIVVAKIKLDDVKKLFEDGADSEILKMEHHYKML